MRAGFRFLPLALLILTTPAYGAGDEEVEERLWKDTGSTHHGRIEVRRDGAVPQADLRKVDPESLKRVRERWAELFAKTRRDEVRPLKYLTVPTEDDLRPKDPESVPGLPAKAPGDFVFWKNTNPSGVAPSTFSSTVNEPSVVAVRDHVFFTGNWYTASSGDGGSSFSFVNPFTGPYAPANDGFCCDQVTAYDPGTDALFYLQQFLDDGSSGTQRINVDLGADGSFDCRYNITPQVLGFPAATWSDFPDLATSNGYLYHSSNVFFSAGGSAGAFVARYPLSAVGTCAATPFDVYSDSSFGSFKLARGATRTMYFGDHISTSSLRIWSWPEAAGGPSSVDRAVTTWSNSTRVCHGPDGRDWCGFIDSRLAGAWVADGIVGLMWNPAQGGGFPFPYTRIARFSTAGLTLVSEPVIWSNSFAWVYPSVAVNVHGDLGGTIMAGGGASLYPSCIAWIADDVNGDSLAPLENQVAAFGTSGPVTNRSGDYNSTQTYFPNRFLWAGACFSYLSTSEGHARYVLFGREAYDSVIFADGFESGQTVFWSVP